MKDPTQPVSPFAEIPDFRLAIDRAVFAEVCAGVRVEDALAVLCQAVEQQSPGMLCSILIFKQDRIRLFHAAAPSLPESYIQAINGVAIGPNVGSCGTAAYRREPVIVSDIANDPLWTECRNLALDHGLRACWSTPITSSKEEVLGTFAAYYQTARLPTDRERQLIKWAAPLAAISIERKHANDSLRHQREQLQTILDAAPAMIWYKDKENRILLGNRAAAESRGLQKSELEGRYTHEVDPAEAAEYHRRDLEVIHSGKPMLGTYEPYQSKSGDTRHVLTDRFPYRDSDGDVIGVIVFDRDVTEQQVADMERRKAEGRYRSLVEHLPAVIYVAEFGRHGRWSYVSPQIQDLLGFSPEEWIADQAAWANHLHPEDRERVVALEMASAAKAESFVSEYRMLTRTGEVVWVRDEGTILLGESGAPLLMQGVMLDITESKTARKALQDVQYRLGVIVNNVPLVFFALDLAGVFTLSEGRGLQALGLKPGEVVGRSVFDLYRDYPSILENVRRALAGEEFTSIAELPELELTYELKWTPEKDSSGKLVGVIGVATDISERKKAEETLERQAKIIESSSEFIGLASPEGQVIYVNSAGRKLMGLDASEDITQLKINDFTRPEDHRKVAEIVATLLQKKHWEGEFRFKHLKSGQTIPVYQYAFPIVNPATGEISSFANISHDIAERKLAEDKLRQSEIQVRTILDTEPECVKLIASDCTLVEMNKAGLAMIEADSLEQVKGQSLLRIIAPQYRSQFSDLTRSVFRGESGTLEFQIVGLKGSRRSLQTHAVPLLNTEGKVEHLLAVTRDITEKQKLELQLLQAQKMEAVGRLAGGIAHDFNNLLMVINGQLELLHEQSAAGDSRTNKIEQAQKAADRAAALTRQLLAFSRMQVLQPRIISLNDVVTGIAKLLPTLLGANIELAVQTDPNLGSVKADPVQLEQVLLNLALNARDAMPTGGKLVIETRNAELDATFARLHSPLIAGRYVMLTVSDTGMGMDEETQARIFEPFFTTKAKGKGTGLGLATVYGIVKQSNGYIWADSKPGQETRFTVHLPLIEEPADSLDPVEVSSHPSLGTETILLTEDEHDVRAVTRDFLIASGFTVLEAKNGEEALAIARKHPNRIHVLLTDMVMPGISGSELAVQMASVRPETKVVYMSGYSQYTVFEQKDFNPAMVLLQKPFTRESLTRMVRGVIDGSGSTCARIDC